MNMVLAPLCIAALLHTIEGYSSSPHYAIKRGFSSYRSHSSSIMNWKSKSDCRSRSVIYSDTDSSSSSSSSSTNTWQEDLDSVLDVDTSCDRRKDLIRGIVEKSSDIVSDVQMAIQDRDSSKVAPETLSYGKGLLGLQKFQEQVLTDIIPDFLTRGIPRLVEDGPNIVNNLVATGPDGFIKTGQELLTTIQDMTQDPSLLQSTKDDIVNELKNVVKSTPVGIDSPAYEVLERKDVYEVRSYVPYSIVSTSIDSNEEMMEPIATGKSFNTLATYIFGDNSNNEKMTMTTPVIIEGRTMNFVLPKYLKADNAPYPTSDNVVLKDVSKEILAVREFSGIATENEVNQQKAILEDALIMDGIVYDSISFKVFQYNPPYTLPWVRRNEVSFCVTLPALPDEVDSSEEVMTVAEGEQSEYVVDDDSINNVRDTFKGNGGQDDEDTFFTSPEAGD